MRNIQKQLKEYCHSYSKSTADYLTPEKRILENSSSAVAVLVSTDSLQKLRSAYPNYYLDTEMFLSIVKEVTSKAKPKKINLFKLLCFENY